MDKVEKRNRLKARTVTSLFDDIADSWDDWTATEQTEIYNRLGIRLMERKKDRRSELIKEARELQQSIIDIRI